MERQELCGLLEGVSRVEIATAAIDRAIMKNALDMSVDCETLTERICRLTERKIKYINLKIAVSAALAKMSKKYSAALKLFFYKKRNYAEIAEITGWSQRSVYRLVVEGLDELVEPLADEGVDAEVFRKNFYGDKLFICPSNTAVRVTPQQQERAYPVDEIPKRPTELQGHLLSQ